MRIRLTLNGLWKSVLMVVVLASATLMIAAWTLNQGTGEGKESIMLDGTSWELVSFGGQAKMADSQVTARFEDGTIAGSAGVNHYFASYEQDGTSLTFGPAGSTMMMGPEALMQQEMAFLSALQTADAFRIDGETLEISYDGGFLLFGLADQAE